IDRSAACASNCAGVEHTAVDRCAKAGTRVAENNCGHAGDAAAGFIGNACIAADPCAGTPGADNRTEIVNRRGVGRVYGVYVGVCSGRGNNTDRGVGDRGGRIASRKNADIVAGNGSGVHDHVRSSVAGGKHTNRCGSRTASESLDETAGQVVDVERTKRLHCRPCCARAAVRGNRSRICQYRRIDAQNADGVELICAGGGNHAGVRKINHIRLNGDRLKGAGTGRYGAAFDPVRPLVGFTANAPKFGSVVDAEITPVESLVRARVPTALIPLTSGILAPSSEMVPSFVMVLFVFRAKPFVVPSTVAVGATLIVRPVWVLSP